MQIIMISNYISAVALNTGIGTHNLRISMGSKSIKAAKQYKLKLLQNVSWWASGSQ